ncbi:DUF4920 domain-containing protein [Kaistella polysaccharea]|uniref:DUF4920 domain-containing protein n=1 Tax=Kaistella polysaccharea TaxID=2878534 RepID=UPI001CF431DA|nr:DUF4920 domain-containing protein [Kaistella polysaccharea]
MKKLFILFSLSFATLAIAQEKVTLNSGPPAGNAVVGDQYGTEVSEKAEKTAMTVKKLEEQLKKSEKLENVSVKGKVKEVCDQKGCWMTVETDNNEKFFVKMKDYAFFVPTALVGKNVILEGNVENSIISVDEQRHYAEDAKKSQAEIDAITKPKEEIRFMASGIKVVK